MHDLHLFTDLALIFTVAVGVALVGVRFGAPPVLAYLAAGVLLGPPGLGLVARGESIELLAEIGVILLLFTVGLEFSLREVRRSWKVILLAGSLQVGGMIGLTTAVAVLVGRSWQSGLAWGFLAAMSSTALVLRLLDARGETKAAHGRLVIGVLIFQDLCLVPMMLLLPVLAGQSTGGNLWMVFAKAILFVGGTLVLAQRVVPQLLGQVARARNREMFLLAVLAVAGGTAWITSLGGLSLALGAFLAGVLLADTEYAHQALADVLPFRSVMMCVFFVSIGMLVDIELIVDRPLDVAGMFLGLIAGNYLVMWIAGLMLRFPVRVAVLAAAALAQVGEFSFVLSGRVVELGLVDADDASVFLAASVLTMAATPILLAAFPKILAGSRVLGPLEGLLDRAAAIPEPIDLGEIRDHVIVAGLGVGGRVVVAALEQSGIDVVIVELNPATVETERTRGRNVVYGDVAAPEVLIHAGLGTARALCLVTSDVEASLRTMHVARTLRADIPVVVRTRFATEEGAARGPGVFVVSEEFAGAASVAGTVLRVCGVPSWPDVVDAMVADHEHVPAEQEDTLGPPPISHAARARAQV